MRFMSIPLSTTMAVLASYIGSAVLHHDRLPAVQHAAAGAAVISTFATVVSVLVSAGPNCAVILSSVFAEFFGQPLGYVMFTGHAAPGSAFADAATGVGLLAVAIGLGTYRTYNSFVKIERHSDAFTV